jgi:hypothetical protein
LHLASWRAHKCATIPFQAQPEGRSPPAVYDAVLSVDHISGAGCFCHPAAKPPTHDHAADNGNRDDDQRESSSYDEQQEAQ